MGEVYRATDSRLGRDVALKIVPDVFASDATRMGRFEREAKILASLNHPNIAAIYGLEESNGIRTLAMELAEGQTLAERIGQGAVPVDDAMPIAKQICDALEYAHERGVIHRDLKPANVKITPDGTVKVLDFGLAKALEGETSGADMSNSPTLSQIATPAGILLGTAAYMAPEQARGKRVDCRAGIWAFGVVLYEMLTGKPLFSGETTSDMLAEVIKSADGSGKENPVLASKDSPCVPSSWSPDGKYLRYWRLGSTGKWETWVLPIKGERKPRTLLANSEFDLNYAAFSPDGKYLAYSSNESGRSEIYVTPFGQESGKWQISTRGGINAVWARSGKQLFYRESGNIVAVDVITQPAFSASTPRVVAPAAVTAPVSNGLDIFDVSPHGKRFLIHQQSSEPGHTVQINVVLNWSEQLRHLAASGKNRVAGRGAFAPFR